MAPITLNPSTWRVRASRPVLPYHRLMIRARNGLTIDEALLVRISELVGTDPDDVIEYVERAVRHEIRRAHMRRYLDELDARLGPTPEEQRAEAEAFWFADEPAEDDGDETGEHTSPSPEDAGASGRQVRVLLNVDLLARIIDVVESEQVREFVEQAIRHELRQGKSGLILASLEVSVDELAVAGEEGDAAWPAG